MAMTCRIMIFMLSLSGLISPPQAAMLREKEIKMRLWMEVKMLACLGRAWVYFNLLILATLCCWARPVGEQSSCHLLNSCVESQVVQRALNSTAKKLDRSPRQSELHQPALPCLLLPSVPTAKAQTHRLPAVAARTLPLPVAGHRPLQLQVQDSTRPAAGCLLSLHLACRSCQRNCR